MNQPELMTGAPPPAELLVTLENWRQAPFNRWGFRNVRNLVPSAPVRRDPSRSWELERPRGAHALAGLGFRAPDGTDWDVARWLEASFTDALMVLAGGRVVAELYFNGMTSDEQHILMSVSKSVTGALAGIVVADGKLDPDAPVAHYVPEVAAGGYAGATVRHLLDMRAAIGFVEDYGASDGPMIRYREAMYWKPPVDPLAPPDLRGFVIGLLAEGAHGGPFRYVSPTADLLGWVIERAAGQDYASLLTERVWHPLGAVHDAYITVDRLGAPRAAGGLCVTLGDFARFGLMLLRDGCAEDREIVPSDWLQDIRFAGDPAAWRDGDFGYLMPGGAYRNQWYVTNRPDGAFYAVGIHGQWLYLVPEADVVIAKLSSAPLPTDDAMDAVTMAAFEAIAAEVGA